jgi:uncharacterized cupredoxin-like copper-binding protein
VKVRTGPRSAWLTMLGVSLTLLGACSPAPTIPSGDVVDLTLKDFHIIAATSQVTPGDVVFHVENDAPVTHEFVVVRSDLPDDELPIGSDGLSVDEESLDVVDEIPDLPAGTAQALALDLPGGRYVFFCNLEGHYLGGMHGTLVVADA